MSTNTKKVAGRRDVRYATFDDLLADAERWATEDQARTLGNWSRGQIFRHLALAFDSSIDGGGFKLPAPARWFCTLLLKKRFLTRPLPAGFKAPAQYVPDETAVDEALADLRRAVERQKSEAHRAPHPALGNISREQWDQFHLRHAEMHMSFLVSDDGQDK